MKRLLLVPALCATMLAACDNQTQTAPPAPRTTTDAPRDIDNTGVNTRDRAESAVTADQAGQQRPDVELAAEIRQRVTDTEMSVNAQNCKIIVDNGRVTLRGPVKNQLEKDTIGRMAESVAGPGNVINELEIESNP